MRPKSHGRGGFALALVCIIAAIAGILIFVFQQSVVQEFRGTSRLVRAARAEAIGESAVAKIASAIGHDPWEERFYLRYALRMGAAAGGAPAIEYPFNHESFPFFEDGPEFRDGAASFVGSIRDVAGAQRRYRVRVLVQYQGAEVLLVYDMHHAAGIMGPLNRDPVLQRASLDGETPMDMVDSQVTAIWDEAQDPAAMIDGAGAADAALLNAVDPQPPQDIVFASMEEPPAPPPEIISPEEYRNVAEPAAEGMKEILEEVVENPMYRPPPPTENNPWGLPPEAAQSIPYEEVPPEAVPPEYRDVVGGALDTPSLSSPPPPVFTPYPEEGVVGDPSGGSSSDPALGVDPGSNIDGGNTSDPSLGGDPGGNSDGGVDSPQI